MSSDRGRLPSLIVLGLVLLPGCAMRTVLDASAVDTHGRADQEFEFWDELATRPVVTNHDALHGLLLLEAAEAPAGTWEGRLEQARQRGWISAGSSPPANESSTVGMISVAICDILEIRGGLVMSVFGPSPDRCTHELVYLGIVTPCTANQSLSGLEFADVVRRAADRRGAAPETG